MEDGGNKMGRGAINETEEDVGVGFIPTVFNKPFYLKIKQKSAVIFFPTRFIPKISGALLTPH